MCYYRNAKINFKRYDQLTADLRRSHYHIVILVTTRLIYNSYVSCYLLFIIYNYTINKPIVNRLRIPKQGIITINNRSVFIIWQNVCDNTRDICCFVKKSIVDRLTYLTGTLFSLISVKYLSLKLAYLLSM